MSRTISSKRCHETRIDDDLIHLEMMMLDESDNDRCSKNVFQKEEKEEDCIRRTSRRKTSASSKINMLSVTGNKVLAEKFNSVDYENESKSILIEFSSCPRLICNNRNERLHPNLKSKIILWLLLHTIVIFGNLIKFTYSLPISPSTRESAIARIGSTTIDDDELSRTMDRSGLGHEDDDPPISAFDSIARSAMDLVHPEESINRFEIIQTTQADSRHHPHSIQAKNASIVHDLIGANATSNGDSNGELPSDSQIALSVAPGERQPPTFISVLNNQSRTINLDDKLDNNNKNNKSQLSSNFETSDDNLQKPKQHNQQTHATSDERGTGEGIELLHNVAMNEPSDSIQSSQTSNESNDTELRSNNNTSGHHQRRGSNANSHDMRSEKRRRKTTGQPETNNNKYLTGGGGRDGVEGSKGSIKSVIGQPKQLTEPQPKFGLPTRLIQTKAITQSRSTYDPSSTFPSNQMIGDDLQRSTIESQNISSVISTFSNDTTNNDPSGLKSSSSINEMRAFESATVETTANSNGNSNTDDSSNDDDDMNDSSNNGPSSNNESRGQDNPSMDNSANEEQQQQQSSDAKTGNHNNNRFNTNNSDNRQNNNLSKPIRIQASGSRSPASSNNNNQAMKNINKSQQQLSSTSNTKSTHHELLVGPFKSEAEAPETMILNGMVYQKSSSSSTSSNSLPLTMSAAQLMQLNPIVATTNLPEMKQLASSSSHQIIGAYNNLKNNKKAKSQDNLADSFGLVNLDQGSVTRYTTVGRQPIVNDLQDANLIASNTIDSNKYRHQQQQHQTQWSPQALPGGTQLFLPISQAQLISLLGQPAGKLLTSASQTIVQAAASAAAASKSKDKGKLSVTLTSIPTGESILSSLASSLEFKLANPVSNEQLLGAGAKKQHHPFASASSLSSSPPDLGVWPTSSSSSSNSALATSSSSLSSSSTASPSTQNTNTINNEALKAEQLYLNALLQGVSAAAASSTTSSTSPPNNQNQFDLMAADSASKDLKTHPVVIVEKSVKPVKYHLLRAYLKLRRLLKPAEATYVFPAGSLKRGQSFAGQPNG